MSMERNDDHYIGVRITEEEWKTYKDKLAKTTFTGKLFLLKLLDGNELRERAPDEVRSVQYHLLRIQENCFQLWAGENVPADQKQIYYARCRYLEKLMADITNIAYFARQFKTE